MSDDRFDNGMAVRRLVLGDAHVDRAEANKTPFDEDFQRYITESAWGSVWTRPGLDKPTRSLLTLALLAANRGYAIAKQTYKEMEEQDSKGGNE